MQEKGSDDVALVALVDLKRVDDGTNDSENIHEVIGKRYSIGLVEEVKKRVMFTPDDIERIMKSLDTKSASGYYYHHRHYHYS